MPWTSGTYIRDNGVFTGPLVWTDDRDAGTKITSAHHDTHDQDIADGITATLNTGGQNSPVADIDWGGFKIVNMADGALATDAATYGQTVTAANLNASTNVLSLTVASGDVTVDLSALAVGGSTIDFARYSNAANPFQGSATFAGTVGVFTSLSLQDPISPGYTWVCQATSDIRLDIANTAGAQLTFTGNSSSAGLYVNSKQVWTTENLPAATVAGLLTATGNYSISGTFDFTTGGLILPPVTTQPFTSLAGNWTCTSTYAAFKAQMTWANNVGPMTFAIKQDSAYTSGGAAVVGGNDVWDKGSLQVLASAAPTGGRANDCAVVQTGANKGLWSNIAGTWTQIL